MYQTEKLYRLYAKRHMNKQENWSHCIDVSEKMLTAVRNYGDILGF